MSRAIDEDELITLRDASEIVFKNRVSVAVLPDTCATAKSLIFCRSAVLKTVNTWRTFWGWVTEKLPDGAAPHTGSGL